MQGSLSLHNKHTTTAGTPAHLTCVVCVKWRHLISRLTKSDQQTFCWRCWLQKPTQTSAKSCPFAAAGPAIEPNACHLEKLYRIEWVGGYRCKARTCSKTSVSSQDLSSDTKMGMAFWSTTAAQSSCSALQMLVRIHATSYCGQRGAAWGQRGVVGQQKLHGQRATLHGREGCFV